MIIWLETARKNAGNGGKEEEKEAKVDDGKEGGEKEKVHATCRTIHCLRHNYANYWSSLSKEIGKN